MQPICNRFMKKESEFAGEKRYPLKVVFCPKCTLLQLSEQLPTRLLFDKDFNYISSSSKSVVKHYTELAERYVNEFNLGAGDWVADIGSNDGVFLLPLKEKAIGVVGIDPGKEPARIANERGVFTLDEDFVSAEPKVNALVQGRLKLLTAFDVIAHTGNIGKFLDKVAHLLKDNIDAPFISQSHYMPNVIDRGEFDTIYHEHQRFYTITSMQNLFNKHHLYIYDCEQNEFYGGSIIAYASYEPKQPTERLNATLEAERKYADFATYEGFKEKVEGIKSQLVSMLKDEKARGRHIVGIGAPMKSATLLNYCNIDGSLVDYLTETNKMKAGKYSPGVHLYVDEDERLLATKNTENIDALILSWNMAEVIIKNLREKGFKGKIVIPIPEVKIV